MKKAPMEPGFDPARLAQFNGRAEYTEITFDGSRWPFLVNGFGLKKAQEATGKDVMALLYDVVLSQTRALMLLAKRSNGAADEPKETAQRDLVKQIALAMQTVGFTSNMQAYATYFYAGVITFYPEMTHDDAMMRITKENMQELEPLIAEQVEILVKERDAIETPAEAEPAKN